MKKITAISVLNIPIHPFTMAESVAYLDTKLQRAEKTFVVTANSEIIMMCQNDKDYRDILTQAADLVLPDGAGTVWAGRKLGHVIPERVAGFDLFNKLLAVSSEKSYKVYFLGGAPDIVENARKNAERLYPGINIVGCHNGFFKEDDENTIIQEINASEAEILFVALGAPKQEKWLYRYINKLQPSLLMGIGGSFDVLAGKMERAPLWMQKYSLEWLFRLYKQPSRIGRMMVLPKFVIKVLHSK